MNQTVPTTSAMTKSPKPHRRSASNAKQNHRFAGIDLIKILACFLVITVHFFLHSGFYQYSLSAEFGYPQTAVRWIAYCCVPLFMITTGYVMRNKTFSAKYYLGILRVLILYIAISIGTIIFKIHYHNLTFTPWTALKAICHFNGVDYAWYCEYYFTIFLLIPFINAAYEAMGTRKKRLAMLLTVLFVTSVSQTVHIGSELSDQIRLFPGSRLGIYLVAYYPILYYVIGLFIRDYPPRHHRGLWKLSFLLVFCAAIAFMTVTTVKQTLQTEMKWFVSWHFDHYGALPVVIASTALFLLLFDIRSRSKTGSLILQVFSKGTFCAFLFSYIFDSIAYRKLNRTIAAVPERFRYAPLVILFVFSCSIVSGVLIQGLYDLIVFLVTAPHRKRKKAGKSDHFRTKE